VVSDSGWDVRAIAAILSVDKFIGHCSRCICEPAAAQRDGNQANTGTASEVAKLSSGISDNQNK